MRKSRIVCIAVMAIFAIMFVGSFIYPLVKKESGSKGNKTKSIVTTEEYTKYLREEVVEDLYGNREAYAAQHTGSRADYIDKNASQGSTLVIDEERMERVYQSKLAEYDAMIDQSKVDALVKERQDAMISEGVFDDISSNERTLSAKQRRWNEGGRCFGGAVIIVMLFIVCFQGKKKEKAQ